MSIFNGYEYDKFQNLELRFVLGGGRGYHAIQRERSRLDLLAGAGYNRSSFSTPLIRNPAELYWGDEYSLKVSAAASLTRARPKEQCPLIYNGTRDHVRPVGALAGLSQIWRGVAPVAGLRMPVK